MGAAVEITQAGPERLSALAELLGRAFVGGALARTGLTRARKDRVDAFLETGTPANVPLYEHLGFRVVDSADAPDGGPRIWFMRWDSEILAV